MSKPEVRLEDWAVIKDSYNSPTGPLYGLIGRVFGHSRIENNHGVTTSPIVRWIDQDTVETLNTIYKLGDMSKAYKIFLYGGLIEYATPATAGYVSKKKSNAQEERLQEMEKEWAKKSNKSKFRNPEDLTPKHLDIN